MKNYLKIFLLFFALFFSYCSTTEYISIDNTSYPPVKDCSYYEDPVAINYKYEIIGIVRLIRSPGGLTRDDIKVLIKMAENNGADGIIEVSKEEKICKGKALRFIRDSEGYPVKK